MTENTKTEFADLQNILRCCDSVLDNLNSLRGQLVHIVEAKKKQAELASDNAVFSQSEDNVSSSIATLEEIESKLPGAIDEITKLSKQASLLKHPEPAAAKMRVEKG